jgi:hypothetical protein
MQSIGNKKWKQEKAQLLLSPVAAICCFFCGRHRELLGFKCLVISAGAVKDLQRLYFHRRRETLPG